MLDQECAELMLDHVTAGKLIDRGRNSTRRRPNLRLIN
jgi:hypothetical protein